MIRIARHKWQARLGIAWLTVAFVGLGQAQAAELLMFETRGCPWCKLWHAEVGPGYAKSSEGRRAPLRQVDLSQADQAGVALSALVTASPTFVLADKGIEVGRITGYPGPDFFWGLLGELVKKLEKGAWHEWRRGSGTAIVTPSARPADSSRFE